LDAYLQVNPGISAAARLNVVEPRSTTDRPAGPVLAT
jgi:hypothetical protein